MQVINLKNEHYKLIKALSFDVDFVGYNGILNAAMEESFLRPQLDWTISKK